MNRALLIVAGVSGILAAAAFAAQRAELVDVGELQAGLEDLVGMGPAAAELYAISREPNVAAFSVMIRVGEGTSDPDGYRRLFGGELIDTFADHPRKAVTRLLRGMPITSTAAGAGQFLERTWDEIAAKLELPDFSPASQDVAIVALIRRRGALEDVRAGRFEDAVRKCAKEWASLPGSPYGQPTRTIDQARTAYASAGGSFA